MEMEVKFSVGERVHLGDAGQQLRLRSTSVVVQGVSDNGVYLSSYPSFPDAHRDLTYVTNGFMVDALKRSGRL